jgi:geranylgeranyl diphosphate synthase, type II
VQALDTYLDQTRRTIDQALEHYLEQAKDCPPLVLDAMRYSLMAGGKRLRPVLTLTCAEAVALRRGTSADRARELALPAACAVEMLHTYSLIHDDLPAMDDDVLRRGRPTSHVVFGDGMAILAGDGLQAEAFALMAREPAGGDSEIGARKLRAIERIATAVGVAGMVGGQAIDLEAVRPGPGRPAPPAFDGNSLEDMHMRKTGALIRAAATSGAIMAGADDQNVRDIDSYARAIGLAFQIVDDILDVEGSSALGKTTGKDAAAGKPTYPALFGMARSREMANECVERARDALSSGGFQSSRLDAIADWIAHRHS